MSMTESVPRTASGCQALIERALLTHGGTAFAYCSGSGQAQVMLFFPTMVAAFHLPLPDRGDRRFHFTPERHVRRSAEKAFEDWEKACLAVWQSLTRLISAKFEAVDAGITTIGHEFSLYPADNLAALVAPAFAQQPELTAERVPENAGA